jgi:putative hemolysin
LDPEDPYSLSLNVGADFSSLSTEIFLLALTLCLMLILSGILSGYETALLSLTKNELNDFSRMWRPAVTHSVNWLQERPRQFWATKLALLGLFQMGSVIILCNLLDRLPFTILPFFSFPIMELGMGGIGILYLTLLLPRALAYEKKYFYLQAFSPLLYWLFRALAPVASPIAWLMGRLYNPDNLERRKARIEDLKLAINKAQEQKASVEGKKILKALVNLSNIPVRSVMRARIDIKAINLASTTEEALKKVAVYGYSRLPVYENSYDQIVGIIYVKDLLSLLGNPEADWRTLIREAYFVPATQKINQLFEIFKEKKIHIAIVVDEFGGAAGLVTLEDILEEIFGEINEEGDDDNLTYSQISESEYIFEGKTSILDICKITGIDDSSFKNIKGKNDSLGGLILELKGKFPQKGETIVYGPFRFLIESVTPRAIQRVKFTILKSARVSENNRYAK